VCFDPVICTRPQNVSDPENCTTYFYCDGSNLYSRSCGPGETFHQVSYKCTSGKPSCYDGCVGVGVKDYKQHIVYETTVILSTTVATSAAMTNETTVTVRPTTPSPYRTATVADSLLTTPHLPPPTSTMTPSKTTTNNQQHGNPTTSPLTSYSPNVTSTSTSITSASNDTVSVVIATTTPNDVNSTSWPPVDMTTGIVTSTVSETTTQPPHNTSTTASLTSTSFWKTTVITRTTTGKPTVISPFCNRPWGALCHNFCTDGRLKLLGE